MDLIDSAAATGTWVILGALIVSATLLVRQVLLPRAHRVLLTARSRQALHDPVTGLLNRRAFDQDREQHLHRSRRDVASLVLVVLDGLKTINDSGGGHRGGDAALVATAAALFRAGRRADRV
ncbi:MAG: GGDEF domain-containing protein [Candidatus Dormibacteria bacterium]